MIKRLKSIGYIRMLSLFIGIITGLLAVLFLWIFSLIGSFYHMIHITPQNFIWFPLFGGIVIALINFFFMKKRKKNFGVLAVIEEIEDIHHQKIDIKTALIQLLGNIVSVSTGFPVGRFGPIVYIGGTIGSFFGYKVKLDREDVKTLLACGVAGAVSGVFNSPLLGPIFVIEVIFRHNHLKRLIPILISAITSLLIKRVLLPDVRIFPEVHFEWISSLESYKTLILFGIFMGTIAIVYIYVTTYIDKFLNQHIQKNYIKPLLAGIIITIFGSLHPYFFDFPFTHFFEIVKNPLIVDRVWLLLSLRLIGTAIALWGTYGGTFMPGLMIGAIASGAFYTWLDNPVFTPSVIGLLGVGAIFSGFANAPLTATLLIFELSGHSSSVMEIFILNIVTSLFVEALAKESHYNT